MRDLHAVPLIPLLSATMRPDGPYSDFE